MKKMSVTKVLEFVRPRTAVGFLAYGWIGGAIGSLLSQAYIWPGFIFVLAVWIPLWVLASRARDSQIAISGYLRELEAEEKDDDGRTTNTD